MVSSRGGPTIAPSFDDFDGISNSNFLQNAPALLQKDRVGEVKVIGVEQIIESPLEGAIYIVAKFDGY